MTLAAVFEQFYKQIHGEQPPCEICKWEMKKLFYAAAFETITYLVSSADIGIVAETFKEINKFSKEVLTRDEAKDTAEYRNHKHRTH